MPAFSIVIEVNRPTTLIYFMLRPVQWHLFHSVCWLDERVESPYSCLRIQLKFDTHLIASISFDAG